jgi:putative mRNA 3-end processing factor
LTARAAFPTFFVVHPPLVCVRDEGLYCEAGGFFIDPRLPVERAILTHGHADHARSGSTRYLAATPGLTLLRHRLPDATIDGLAYGEARTLGDVRVSLHPAGHMLGSAQVRIERIGGRDGDRKGEVWVVSGDYKRAEDPSCAPFEPIRCDVFVTEATFALPIYQWKPTHVVVDAILDWWRACGERGQAAVLFAYAAGKAQRLLAELAKRTDRRVLVHGALEAPTAAYREEGVRMLETTLVSSFDASKRRASFAGELVLAPPSARATPWMRRFGDHETAFASGTMRLRGTRRRLGHDRGFVLSDHADWPALLRTIDETGASRVLTMHGHGGPLARFLRERGCDAEALDLPAGAPEARVEETPP